MNIQIFELERIQSLYENTVDYNLTESGFHPFTLQELLSPQQLAEIENIPLGYGQTNGSLEVRKRISALYRETTEDHVLVTNGSSEANFVACHTLLEKGDEIVMMVPNYMQIWGIAQEMGCQTHKFHLREENNWAPDLDELQALVNDRTKMIVICNPNNPTGYTLSTIEMEKIVQIAKKVDAWIFSDEVYRGAELDALEIPSFYGMYEKVLVNGGLSKAYALPGLRLGWLVGPRDLIADSWAYRDYTSITAGILSHKIGEIVLEPVMRKKVLDRNRSMLIQNRDLVLDWIQSFGGNLTLTPPKAGGMAFIRYAFDINSTELADWLRKEHSVFILAGDCFGMDHFFRIGIGAEKEYLIAGLETIRMALKSRGLI